MQVSTLVRRSVRGRVTRFAAGAGLLALAACSGESLSTPEKPVLPDNPAITPAVKAAAWIFDVNTVKKTVKITPPAGKVGSGASYSVAGVEYSLVGADVIALTANNYSASGVGTGGAPAGKVLVKFDLALTNLLSSVDLITPTFPVSPGAGVFAFPFSTTVTTTSGGVTSSGNDVIIDLPNTGQVAPSVDFDGNPYNWFNDTGCPAGSNDCYRYETFPQPLSAGATTAGQQIGFVIDPTVANFRAKIIVAADLANAGPAITRTVAGTVTSPQLGNLGSGSVTITGGFSATPSGGNYSIAGVGAGPRTVSYTAPAGCTSPAPQNITVSGSSPATIPVSFVVTCSAPAGTVTGSISFAAGTGSSPSLSSVVATVTPSASGTSPVNANANAAGAYSAAGVVVGIGAGAGAGAVSFSALPAGCTFVGANTATYTGLTAGGSVAATGVTITCSAVNYPLNYVWGTPSAGTITLTVTIDMNAQNNAINNGAAADLIGAFQHPITFGTRVSAPVCTAGSTLGGPIGLGGSTLSPVLTSTTGAGGLYTLYSCVFTYAGAGVGTSTLTGGTLKVADPALVDQFASRTTVTLNPIP